MKKQLLLLSAVTWTTVLSTLFPLLFCAGYAQTIPADSLYFGQKSPGDTAVVFAPGIVSIPNRNVPCISFAPDGKSAVFYVAYWPNPGTPYCMMTEFTNGRWSAPAPASFSAGRASGEPSFSPDGSRIYLFAGAVQNQVGSVDLSYVEKTGSAWSSPKSMGSPPNLAQDQYHPCLVADSSVYFSTSGGDIAVCRYQNGRYLPRTILPSPVNKANTTQTWGDPYVAPDESYLIFKSTRAGGYGLNDIYITYRRADGGWTNPKNLGSRINTRYEETSGDITPDGKYMTYNSNGVVYWVSAGFIEVLRNSNFVPYLKTKPKNQTGKVGEPLSFILPDSTFTDDDGNASLSWYITSRLPVGVDFDPDTRTISGTPTVSGTYTVNVMVTDNADASATTSFSLKINAASGVENPGFESAVRLYPNPARGMLHLELGSGPFHSVSYRVTSISGQIITACTLNSSNQTAIDLSGSAPGVYYLLLNIDGAIINRKFYLE